MNPETFARLAADLPPQKWAEIRRRINIIETYRQTGGANAAAAASQLGVSRASFYRLLDALGSGVPSEPLVHAQGHSRRLDARTSSHIEDVIAELGPGARISDILWEASRRCAAEGLPIPSMGAVKVRASREHRQMNLSKLLKRSFDLVADVAPLGLAIVHQSGLQGAQAAALFAFLEPNGRIWHHSLTLWPPSLDETVKVTSSAPSWPGRRPALLVQTKSASNALIANEDEFRAKNMAPSPTSSGLRSGVAIRIALGRLIGRVPILSRGATSVPQPVAVRSDAEAIIHRLVDRHNEGIE